MLFKRGLHYSSGTQPFTTSSSQAPNNILFARFPPPFRRSMSTLVREAGFTKTASCLDHLLGEDHSNSLIRIVPTGFEGGTILAQPHSGTASSPLPFIPAPPSRPSQFPPFSPSGNHGHLSPVDRTAEARGRVGPGHRDGINRGRTRVYPERRFEGVRG